MNDLPPHVEHSVRSIVGFHVAHARKASPLERAIERITAALGRPLFVAVITLFVCAWIGVNVYARAHNLRYFDAPPFSWLQDVMSLSALYVTALILTTQRRLDRLAEDRAQLTLQVALVNEQKTAKIIALLEELRSDHPEIANRQDLEADEMSQSTNPQTVLEALRESHDEQLGTENGSNRSRKTSG